MCVSSLHTILIDRMPHYLKDLCPIIMGFITSENVPFSETVRLFGFRVFNGSSDGVWWAWWLLRKWVSGRRGASPTYDEVQELKYLEPIAISVIVIMRSGRSVLKTIVMYLEDQSTFMLHIVFVGKNYASLLDEANEDVNQPSILTNHSTNITEWIDFCGEHANQFHYSQMKNIVGLVDCFQNCWLFCYESVTSLQGDSEQILFFEKLISSFYIIHLFTLLSQGKPWCTYKTLNVLFYLIKTLKEICIIVNLLAKKNQQC